MNLLGARGDSFSKILIGLSCGLMSRVVLKTVRWPIMMNFQVGEVFVLVSIGFKCEFVGFIEPLTHLFDSGITLDPYTSKK